MRGMGESAYEAGVSGSTGRYPSARCVPARPYGGGWLLPGPDDSAIKEMHVNDPADEPDAISRLLGRSAWRHAGQRDGTQGASPGTSGALRNVSSRQFTGVQKRAAIVVVSG